MASEQKWTKIEVIYRDGKFTVMRSDPNGDSFSAMVDGVSEWDTLEKATAVMSRALRCEMVRAAANVGEGAE